MNLLNLPGVDRQQKADSRKGSMHIWDSIDWDQAMQNVNRLQTRIVKAVKTY
jgi:hypothetical protein